MTAIIETGATVQAWHGEFGGQGEHDMHRPRVGGHPQEKSNLRVSDSVASPCCKLLISLNLARAWELAPIPQSCLAGPRLIQSNKTRPVSAHIVQQRTVLGAQQLLTGQCCCLAASGHIKVRGEVSDSESRLSNNETDVEGAMCAPTGGCAFFSWRRDR